jgi:hypothetical protein
MLRTDVGCSRREAVGVYDKLANHPVWVLVWRSSRRRLTDAEAPPTRES